MNEKMEETPNPLNPGRSTGLTLPHEQDIVNNLSESTPLNVDPIEPVRPAATSGKIMDIGRRFDEAPSNNMRQKHIPEIEPVRIDQTESLDPLNRPMEQAPTYDEKKPKKKKIGLIAGIIACLVIALACGIAAILIANKDQGDPVFRAVNKLVNEGVPGNIAVDGVINVAISDPSSPISGLEIKLKGGVAINSMANSTEATLAVDMRDADDFSLRIDEIYTDDNDLYLRIDGLSDVANNTEIIKVLMPHSQNTLEVECTAENNREECIEASDTTSDVNTNEYSEAISNIVQSVDGEWLKISVEQLSESSNSITPSADLNCIAESINHANKYNNSLKEHFNRNSFTSSTDKKAPIASKQNPVYEVGIDASKLTAFIDSTESLGLIDELYTCLNYEYAGTNVNDVAEKIESLPALYVEVDENDNFTRLYFAINNSEAAATITTDLGISYPARVNISEPVEYRNFSDVVQELSTGVYESTYEDPKTATTR